MENKKDGQLDFFSSFNVEEEIKRLSEEIKYHNKKYYDDDEPEISDYEYDKLTQKLKELESQHPEYVVATSPTQKIGGKTKEIFKKVEHEVQMQSLQDVFSYSEIEDFVVKVMDEYGKDTEFVVDVKIDGLSVSLEYENGILVKGSTRGNGFIGEDVTENLKVVNGIPHELKTKDTIEVRGEVYLPRKEFYSINDELIKKGKKELANPRNAAAGTLRQLDTELVKARNLSIFVFNVQKGMKFDSHIESIEYLNNIGIKVVEYIKKCVGVDSVIAAVEEIGRLRDLLEYDIDGAVIKINNINVREEMGSTVKVPKWAIAYKYPPEKKETKILDIVTQVGRTGQVTPMAILVPVRVAGSVISKTTLHNFDFIDEKDIRVGDTVIIQKAGDVIPEVVEVKFEKRNGEEKEYERPEICPVCLEELEKQDEMVALRCTNIECPAQLYRSITHFASRECMDIVGLGDVAVEKLIDAGLVTDVADIYYLKYEDIYNLENYKEKSAQNLLESINKSKTNSLDKLIFGLGIRHIGKKAAKVLSESFDDIFEIMEQNVDSINNLDDFGLVMSESVVKFFKKSKTIEIIKKINEAGVNLKGNKKELSSDKLKNNIFVITGSFEKYSRDEISNIIEDNGGKVSGSVSKKTDFVIAGNDAGSKLKKAEQLQIQVITIDELFDMIK